MIERCAPLVARVSRRSEVAAVHAVAAAAFPDPWSERVFEEELDREWARIAVVRDGLGGPIVAFASFWILRDEIHLLSLATHPAARRRGHARLLLDHVVAEARRARASHVSLEVRDTNGPALALYRAFGFSRIGTRPRYYAREGEDAVVMYLATR